MKKLFCIFLAIAMLISISACGRYDDIGKDDGKNTNPPSGQTTTTPTDAPITDPTDVPVDPTDVPVDPTTPPTTPTDNVFAGNVIDGVYSNAFIGIKINIPEGWTSLSKEQLLESMNIASSLSDEELAAALASTSTIFDLNASSALGSSIQVQLINVPATPTMQSMTPEQVIDTTVEQMRQILVDSGMELQVSEKSNIQLAGNAYSSIDIAMNMMGIEITERLFFRTIGDYMVMIVMAASSFDTTVTMDQLQAMIQPL